MSFNRISSLGPTNGANWASPEENVNAFRQAALGPAARPQSPKPKMATVPLSGAFDRFKNYVKRIGLALVGKDYAQNNKGLAYSVPTSIKPEKSAPALDSDPTIGRWPSTFAAPSEAPPPARTMTPPTQLPTKTATEEFNRVMQEMAQSENEQKAAFELMKGAGAEALGLGAGLGAEGSSLSL